MGVIDITMEEGFTGVDREFDLRKLVVCRDCEGWVRIERLTLFY